MHKPVRTLGRALLAPLAIRSAFQPRIQFSQIQTQTRRYSAHPNVFQPSFWAGLVPKPFRKNSLEPAAAKKPKAKDWNPATFFLVVFLLIGSMSVQMIALRNESGAFERRADAKIGLLKEIIERVQNGETVDVEGLLGTGDKNREKEWEEVLEEIAREDEAWERSRRKKPIRGPKREEESFNVVDLLKATTSPAAAAKDENPESIPRSNAPSGFY